MLVTKLGVTLPHNLEGSHRPKAEIVKGKATQDVIANNYGLWIINHLIYFMKTVPYIGDA